MPEDHSPEGAPGEQQDPTQDLADKLREARDARRGHADFFEWPNRTVKECEICRTFLISLVGMDGLEGWKLEPGDDPPDCVATRLDWQDGRRIGIEVTELVCSDSVEEARSLLKRDVVVRDSQGRRIPTEFGGVTRHWTQVEVLATITERLRAKDQTTPSKDFSEYWVVIHTDEPMLEASLIATYLSHRWFGPFRIIDRAFVLCSYDPRHRDEPCQGYPHFELQLDTGTTSNTE